MVYHPQINGQIERISQEVEVFLQHYINYQHDDWTEWLLVIEFQYNDEKHIVTEHILFELKFGRYLWKENLTVKTESPKLEDFLEGLRRSWEVEKKSMKIVKEAMKKQFDKKRQNPQRLKEGENI